MQFTNFNDNFFSGVGEVFAALRDASGNYGGFFPFGNCPKFEVALTTQRRKHTDSRNAGRLVDKIQTKTKEGEVRITVEDIARKNVGIFLAGNQVTIASGSYASSTYDTCDDSALAVGSIWKLRKTNVASLVIKDSAGSPVTLTLGTDYRIVDAAHGLIEILSLGSYTQPFKAQYTFTALTTVTGMSADDNLEFYLYGAFLNTEPTTDQKIGFHVYRVVFDPAQVLGMINADQGSFDLRGEILRDAVRAADANFGEFCRWDFVTANL